MSKTKKRSASELRESLSVFCKSETVRYRIVLSLCLILSIPGVFVAAYLNDPEAGGRGGALAVAIALANLFIKRNTPDNIIELLTTTAPFIHKSIAQLKQTEEADPGNTKSIQPGEAEEVSPDPNAILAKKEALSQKKQNRFLAGTTFVGTIIWGFGDVFARFLIKQCWWRSFASLMFVALSHWPALQPFPFTKCGERLTTVTDGCVVSRLREPTTQGDSQASGAGLVDLSDKNVKQAPGGCVDSIIARAREDEPILILLVGRTDKRQLNSEGRRLYSDNFTLGYQRALSMKDCLLKRYKKDVSAQKMPLTSDALAQRMVVLTGGPDHIDPKTSKSDMSEDRCVEVFVYWNNKPNLEKSGP